MRALDLLDDAACAATQIGFGANQPEPVGSLWSEARQWAEVMRTQAPEGAVVALVLDNSRAAVVTLFSAWLAGCSVASLPAPARGQDLARYATQLQALCDQIGASRLAIPNSFDDSVVQMMGACRYRDACGSGFAVSSPASADIASPGDLLQFSSGTTGPPAAVRLSQEQLAANIVAILSVLDPQPGAVASSWLPLSHDMGLVGMCLAALVGIGPRWAGVGTVHIDPPESFLRDPLSWLTSCSARGASVTAGPVFALDAVNRRLRTAPSDLGSLACVQTCIVGAEPIRADVLSESSDHLGPHELVETALCPAYGLAEAGLAVAMKSAGERWRAVDTDRGPLGSSGRPLPGYRIEIANTGPFAEVLVTGPSIGVSVPPAPALDRSGWLTTGDVGRLVEGEIIVLGRSDDMVKVGGRKLFLDELDASLSLSVGRWPVRVATCAEEHPGRVAVTVEERDPLDEADRRSVRRAVRAEMIAGFGIAPSRIVHIQRGALPKTASGKVRRYELAQRLPVTPG